MRFTRLFAFISLALVAAALPFEALGRVVVRAIDYGLSLFATKRLVVTGTGYRFLADIGGQSIDPALRQSMRHEASLPRYAADRNT